MDENRKLLGNFEKISKIFDENSIEKLNFYFIFPKFVTKNRALGNNTSFLQQFFSVSGGGGIPPLATPLMGTCAFSFAAIHWPSQGKGIFLKMGKFVRRQMLLFSGAISIKSVKIKKIKVFSKVLSRNDL